MELKFNIGFEELLALIRQLPQDQLTRIKSELEKTANEEKSSRILEKLALDGPVMSSIEERQFEEAREHINQWQESI